MVVDSFGAMLSQALCKVVPAISKIASHTRIGLPLFGFLQSSVSMLLRVAASSADQQQSKFHGEVVLKLSSACIDQSTLNFELTSKAQNEVALRINSKTATQRNETRTATQRNTNAEHRSQPNTKHNQRQTQQRGTCNTSKQRHMQQGCTT